MTETLYRCVMLAKAQQHSGAALPSVSWRPLALPNEHGGWGFLLEPVVLGLIVAPSLAGLLLGAGALAGFLARHPLRLAASDGLRRRFYPRTRACLVLAAGYGTIALAGCTAGVLLAPQALLPLLGGATIALLQFTYDARNRGREIVPEIAGAFAGAAILTSIAVAGRVAWAEALALTILVLARSVPSIVFVRAALRNAGRTMTISLHVVGIAAAIALSIAHVAPPAGVAATTVMLVRAVATREGTPARMIGIRELIYGTAYVLLIGIAAHA